MTPPTTFRHRNPRHGGGPGERRPGEGAVGPDRRFGDDPVRQQRRWAEPTAHAGAMLLRLRSPVTQANIQQTICRSGYTGTVRPSESETERFKWVVAEPAYGQDHVTGELDHLVSLELGGSNDAANLWVEAGSIPNPKDHVENTLHAAVCDGRVSLRAAQVAIAANWATALRKLGLGS